jgi:transcription elongation factor GreA
MSLNKVPMTVEGAEKLRLELEHLKKVERPRIVKAIAEAREHGDLKENAEYHAAREQQSFCEGRIQETGRVIFGATVDLINVETDEAVTYQIVGEDEADIKANKISVSSPIARALVGKEVGEVAVVKAPGGEIEYEIDAVRHI